jgi:hypothetical protein
VVMITFFSVSFSKSDKNLFRNLLAIKAGFWVLVFFRWLQLENAYIKKSKLGLGFTLEFARIRLLCFTLILLSSRDNLNMGNTFVCLTEQWYDPHHPMHVTHILTSMLYLNTHNILCFPIAGNISINLFQVNSR